MSGKLNFCCYKSNAFSQNQDTYIYFFVLHVRFSLEQSSEFTKGSLYKGSAESRLFRSAHSNQFNSVQQSDGS